MPWPEPSPTWRPAPDRRPVASATGPRSAGGAVRLALSHVPFSSAGTWDGPAGEGPLITRTQTISGVPEQWVVALSARDVMVRPFQFKQAAGEDKRAQMGNP